MSGRDPKSFVVIIPILSWVLISPEAAADPQGQWDLDQGAVRPYCGQARELRLLTTDVQTKEKRHGDHCGDSPSYLYAGYGDR